MTLEVPTAFSLVIGPEFPTYNVAVTASVLPSQHKPVPLGSREAKCKVPCLRTHHIGHHRAASYDL